MAYILLVILAAIFAAFVWLVVQIVNQRERWAKAVLSVILLVGCVMALWVCAAVLHKKPMTNLYMGADQIHQGPPDNADEKTD